MAGYRLAAKAESDVLDILAWSHEQFGESARKRYQVLLAAAFRDVAATPAGIGSVSRPELGTGLFVWHLSLSRRHVPSTVGVVHRPRHFVVYRQIDSMVEIVRVLHDAMELSRHLGDDRPAE